MTKIIEGELEQKHNDVFNEVDNDVLFDSAQKIDGYNIDLDDLQNRFQYVMEQSTEHGREVVQNISLNKLSKDTEELLIEDYRKMEELGLQKNGIEKMVDGIPVPFVKKGLRKVFNVAKMEKMRNKTVKEYVDDHFDKLNFQNKELNQIRINVSETAKKMFQSNQILIDFRDEALKGLSYYTSQDDKAKEIQAQELIIQIDSEIETQKGIIDQAKMFEQMAAPICKRIAATLPQIKNRFINQTVMTSSLQKLSEIQESINNTSTLTLKMQDGVLTQAHEIADTFSKNGLADTEEQIRLREKTDKKLASLSHQFDGIILKHKNDVSAKIETIKENIEQQKKLEHK